VLECGNYLKIRVSDLKQSNALRQVKIHGIGMMDSLKTTTIFASPRWGEAVTSAKHSERVRGGFDVFSSLAGSASDEFRKTVAGASG